MLVYGPLEPGVVQTAAHLIQMPRWGAGATLPLSVLVGAVLTYGFERPMSACILKCAGLKKSTRAHRGEPSDRAAVVPGAMQMAAE